MINFLSSLPKIVSKKKKRLGRGLGSGRGAKSGRGTTRHQKARENIPLHFEGGQGRIVKKYPLLRGKGRNKPTKESKIIVKLDKLNLFQNDETVDLEALISKKIVDKKAREVGIVVVNGGKLEKKLHVKLKVSKSAKQEIEKNGGKLIL